MVHFPRRLMLLALGLLAWAACAPPQPTANAPGSALAPAQASAPKRITAAIRGNPSAIQQRAQRDTVLGLDALDALVTAGLTQIDASGARIPQLAEAVPTLENGGWQLSPEGTMRTTWRLKPNLTWHDGQPLTTEDLLFAATVEQDRESGIPRWSGYDLISRIEAPDARTIVVSWSRPYAEADGMFSHTAGGLPMPKHQLEQTWNEDKASLLNPANWTDEYVGLGAFKVRDWVRDGHVVLLAFAGYALGRPKIDEIQVKFLPDSNALMANVLAGVDVTLGNALSFELGLSLSQQWREGTMLTRPRNWTLIAAQFVNTSPPIIREINFRRALLMGTDRQVLVDALFAGQSGIAHSFVDPSEPGYNLIEPSVVKYPYDPRQAAQMIEGLGYSKRADGFFADASGQQPAVSIWTTVSNALQPKAMTAVADQWQRLGVPVEQVPVPIQRMQDREYRAQFPGFELVENPNGTTMRDMIRFHSSQAPLPENGFRQIGNYARYQNPELDGLLDRYFTTIPPRERLETLGGIVHHLTENLPQLPIVYGADATMVANRLIGVTARSNSFTQSWNVQAWDVRE
jgi:peptide/nickel transport system substrate-binding protein